MGTIISLLFKALVWLLLLPVKLIVLPLKLLKLVKWVLPAAAGIAIFKALEKRGEAVEGATPPALP